MFGHFNYIKKYAHLEAIYRAVHITIKPFGTNGISWAIEWAASFMTFLIEWFVSQTNANENKTKIFERKWPVHDLQAIHQAELESNWHSQQLSTTKFIIRKPNV